MKYLIVLFLFLSSCSFRSSEDNNYQEFTYGQEVYIKEGFYSKNNCMVIQEYKSTIFCRIIGIRKVEESLDGTKSIKYEEVKDDYKIKINLDKENVETEILYRDGK